MDDKITKFVSERVYPSLGLMDTNLFSALNPTMKSDLNSCAIICPVCWSQKGFHFFGTSLISCSHCNQKTELIDALVLISDELNREGALDLLLKATGLNISFGKPVASKSKRVVNKTMTVKHKGNVSVKPLPKEDIKEEKKQEPVQGKKLTNQPKRILGISTAVILEKKISVKEPVKIKTMLFLSQLRGWLNQDDLSKESLLKCGWTSELISKAPLGYLPSEKDLAGFIDGELPPFLAKSAKALKKGIVVPWFLAKGDIYLWGYNGLITKTIPAPVDKGDINIACHLYHPIHKKHNWMVVVADPLLASLLIARDIPACAVGNKDTYRAACKSLSYVKKDLYIMCKLNSDMHTEILNHCPLAIIVSEVNPLAFGPYFGAYYKRFIKWPISRFKEQHVEKVIYTEKKALELLLIELKSNQSLVDSSKHVEEVTGYKIEINKNVSDN